MTETTKISNAVIRFAGDSGDGIQLIGNEFTKATALAQNDIGTFPDFPAEIRAPVGTVAGVSGFQIQFSSNEIHTPGDIADVLVVMNSAALKKNLPYLKDGGIIVANEDGFDNKNLRLAGFPDTENPLTDGSLDEYTLYTIPITKLTKEALKDSAMGTKDAERSKNMFVLGLLYWMYHRPIDGTVEFITKKFAKHPDVSAANIKVLMAGYNYGETAEIFINRYEVPPAKMAPGIYRGITGNAAASYGLIAASVKAGLKIFYGSYPITPASDILHELARNKNFGVITFQAEDEIAAISASIGASYGGSLGVTASSGPGIDLKSEAMGLAVMLELPLVIIDVQRAGPSTGMPTKTEQADLMLAFFGRHGEAPLPIIAAQSPADCFFAAFEACRMAVEHMTPVILLSDGYLGNGAEPWRFPQDKDLPEIKARYADLSDKTNGQYYPYVRNEFEVRKWALPGTVGLENRIGGIEKEVITGNISYDPANHQKMTMIREKKIADIANSIPELKLDSGEEQGDLLIISWGSPYGTIKTAASQLRTEGHKVSHLQLRHLNPFPKNLGDIISRFKTILVPEINNGQLVRLIRDKYMVPAIPMNKMQGLPFMVSEIKEKVVELLG